MSKPDITLEPTKQVVSEMAARIYSAYIVHGDLREGEEDQYMERSIREAIRIAKTVQRSVETDDVPPDGEEERDTAGETSRPTGSAKPTEKSVPPPSQEENAESSELDSVIDEALSGEDTSMLRRKDQ